MRGGLSGRAALYHAASAERASVVVRIGWWWRLGIHAAMVMMAAGCGTGSMPFGLGAKTGEAQLTATAFVTADRQELPLRRWLPEGPPRLVLLALHGMNDYGRTFDRPARHWAGRGIATYAYDQRGFGGASGRGRWHGEAALADDAKTAIVLLHRRYPGLPLYVIGESMGAAVAISALTQGDAPATDGVILSAPAVWPRHAMPVLQTALVSVGLALAPSLTLRSRPERSDATDDPEVLAEMAADSLLIRETRLDTLAGVGLLMDAAATAASRLSGRILVLYGDRDKIIPAAATETLLAGLRAGPAVVTAIRYEQGHHLLLRDRQAGRVLADIDAWLESRGPQVAAR